MLFVDLKDSTRRVTSPDGPRSIAAAMAGIRGAVTTAGGEIFSSAGDGLAAFFPDPAAACRAGLAIARWRGSSGAELRLDFRGGIHAGEFVEIEGGYYGPALHVAARLEQIAEPNTLIASGAVAKAVGRDPALRFTGLGPHRLRGFDRPIELFLLEDAASAPHAALLQRTRSRLTTGAHPAKPVVAILPFTILGGEERWRVFAEAFTGELTALLSRFRMLSVIASHSTARAAEKERDPVAIGRKLGARFLVAGTIQATADRLRLFAEITDAHSSMVLWADRYVRVVEDIFQLQEDLTQRIASIVAVQIEASELARVRQKKPESLKTYELLLRGHEHYYRHDRQNNEIARRFYKRAAMADPSFARATASLSKTYNLEWRYRWSRDPDASIRKAHDLAADAVRIDPLEPRGHSELGFTHLYQGNVAASLASYEKALELNPNDADVIAEYGDALTYDGRPADGLAWIATAKELNPFIPDWYLWCEGGALFQSHRYAEAIGVLQTMKDPSEASRLLAAAYAYLGDAARAVQWAARVRAKHPRFSADDWAATQPFRDPADLGHFIQALRLAGLG